ncbi:MAG: hypothetical protein ACYDH6_23400 [Acidimicrobiales bacterium]
MLKLSGRVWRFAPCVGETEGEQGSSEGGEARAGDLGSLEPEAVEDRLVALTANRFGRSAVEVREVADKVDGLRELALVVLIERLEAGDL